MGAEPVVTVVAAVGPQNRGAAHKLLTAHQIAQGVVLMQVHVGNTVHAFRNAVKLTVASVGVGQHDTIGVGCGLCSALISAVHCYSKIT